MTVFQTAADFNNNWQFYLENEIKDLANRDDFSIDHYADSEIFNPELANFINQHQSIVNLVDLQPNESFALGLREKRQLSRVTSDVQTKFRKFKAWLKRLICDLLGSINWENSSTIEIIGLIVVGLIPFFAGSGGLPALLLPIVVSIVAKVLKHGIDAVCVL
jgi:hypothetical protein